MLAASSTSAPIAQRGPGAADAERLRQQALRTHGDLREVLMDLDRCRNGIVVTGDDMRRAAQKLRSQTHGLRAQVDSVSQSLRNDGCRMLRQVAEIQRRLQEDDLPNRLQAREASVQDLSDYLAVLQEQEDARRREAMERQQAQQKEIEELDLILAKKKEEHESRALAHEQRMHNLQAEIEASEVALENMNLGSSGQQILSEKEQRCREWYGMLSEDSSRSQFAVALQEARVQANDAFLHAAAVAVEVSLRDRAQSAETQFDADFVQLSTNVTPEGLPRSIKALAEAPSGPWRHLFGEISEAHQHLLDLCAENDGLKDDVCEGRKAKAALSLLAPMRPAIHQPQPCDPRGHALPSKRGTGKAQFSKGQDPQKSKDHEALGPQDPGTSTASGPRFDTPAWIPSSSDAAAATHPKHAVKSVTSSKSEWEAGGRAPPKRSEGLAFFLGRGAANRFEPTDDIGLRFASSWNDDLQPSSWSSPALSHPRKGGGALANVRRPASANPRRVTDQSSAMDKLKAACKEPLSAALEKADRASRSREKADSGSMFAEMKNSQWITFRSAPSLPPLNLSHLESEHKDQDASIVESQFVDRFEDTEWTAGPEPLDIRSWLHSADDMPLGRSPEKKSAKPSQQKAISPPGSGQKDKRQGKTKATSMALQASEPIDDFFQTHDDGVFGGGGGPAGKDSFSTIARNIDDLPKPVASQSNTNAMFETVFDTSWNNEVAEPSGWPKQDDTSWPAGGPEPSWPAPSDNGGWALQVSASPAAGDFFGDAGLWGDQTSSMKSMCPPPPLPQDNSVAMTEFGSEKFGDDAFKTEFQSMPPPMFQSIPPPFEGENALAKGKSSGNRGWADDTEFNVSARLPPDADAQSWPEAERAVQLN